MRLVYLFELFQPASLTLADTDIFYTVSAALDEAVRRLREFQELEWEISFDADGVLEGVAWFSAGNLAATISTYHLDRGEQHEHHPAIEQASSSESLRQAIDDILQKQHDTQST